VIRPTIGVPIWLWLNLGVAPFQHKRPAFSWPSLDLPITVDTEAPARAMQDTATLAADRRLSPYDAGLFNAPGSRSAWPGRSRGLARETGSAQIHLRFLRVLRFNLSCFANPYPAMTRDPPPVSRRGSQQGS